MLHLGILAHSTEGAALCFRAFCQQGFERLGEYDHPDVTLDCISMSKSMPHWDDGNYAAVRVILRESVERLAKAGADFFVCPDNTAHMAMELPGGSFAIPGLHLPHVVAERAAEDGRTAVGVLGTSYTMSGTMYADAFASKGIRAQVPNERDRESIHRIIFDELLDGDFRPESRAEYVRIISSLAEQGCDAVALVCTEIPLLVTPDVSPLPTLDSTRLLATAAFEVCVGDRPMPTWLASAEHEIGETVDL